MHRLKQMKLKAGLEAREWTGVILLQLGPQRAIKDRKQTKQPYQETAVLSR